VRTKSNRTETRVVVYLKFAGAMPIWRIRLRCMKARLARSASSYLFQILIVAASRKNAHFRSQQKKRLHRHIPSHIAHPIDVNEGFYGPEKQTAGVPHGFRFQDGISKKKRWARDPIQSCGVWRHNKQNSERTVNFAVRIPFISPYQLTFQKTIESSHELR